MNKGVNVKRTLTKLLIPTLVLIIGSAIFFVYLYNQNPNAPKHAATRDALIKFYDLYVKSVDHTEEFFPDHNPQLVINYRFWYGDIQSYRILKIRDIDHPKQNSIFNVRVIGKTKEALVEVMVKGTSTPFIDTVRLELVEDKWLIVGYTTTNLHKMP
ncbi:hypothetical protein GCM10008018_72680 [Paenibacillus marchantiophytorum]|uniref:DUF4878 domain-containing protein n=1 Tax=Paenibacillus marchantiophytorum TaxID=1619310 RepID=A0ABQ1FL53_9BACL|nr:hypothetical protein [Paenibacillus marchantiophytorum]GGA18156.1 hypothetical protein GCM10008018_72680 [Paenibacillus marchantiophytorum]